MERIDIQQPIAEDDRDEFDQRVRGGGSSGQRLIFMGVFIAISILILFGVARQNNWLGMGEEQKKKAVETVPKVSDQAKPKITLPDLVETKKETIVAESVLCSNGMRLPKGMPCPEGSSVSQTQSAPQDDPILRRKLRGAIQAPALQARPEGELQNKQRLAESRASELNSMGKKSEGLSSQIPETFTPKAYARVLLNPSLTLAKGQLPDCTLITAINTSRPGFFKCQLSFPVLSLNGKVILMEAGTVLEGEYKSKIEGGHALVQSIITRARTPKNIIIPLDSLATDPLGRSGIDGQIDNRWLLRFGGAIVSAIIEDGIEVYKTSLSGKASGDDNVITQYPNTNSSGKAITDEFLKQGSNAQPEVHVNQGQIVKVFVSRDIDFSKVYKLKSMPSRNI